MIIALQVFILGLKRVNQHINAFFLQSEALKRSKNYPYLSYGREENDITNILSNYSRIVDL